MGVAEKLINSLRNRRLTNNHNVVGIQGDPGIGKSTLAMGMALNLDAAFTVEGIHYSREHWRHIINSPKGAIFLLDEGANVAMSRTWADKSQVKLMQLLNMIRQRNHTLIWCTPNLQRLDIVIREDLLTHRINCVSRGRARVRTRRLDINGENDGWQTWPGVLAWPSLDQHPIWPAYYAAKEANFAGKAIEIASNEPSKQRSAAQQAQSKKLGALAKQRDPETGRIVAIRQGVEA